MVEVLTEIEKLFESCEYDDCCIGGDLNTDIRRDKVTVRAITTFMNKIGLVSVWEKFPIDFTHVHKDLKSFWIFDTFFVKKDLIDMVEDAGPVYCITNMSQHSPIMIKVKLREAQPPKALIKQPPRPRLPTWFKGYKKEKHLYSV